MPQIRFTKIELRSQQYRLDQLQKYLPTLQLKKALLQLEVDQIEAALEKSYIEFKAQEQQLLRFAKLLADPDSHPLFAATEIAHVEKQLENVAGVDVPIFKKVHFVIKSYSLFDTPVWMESSIHQIEAFLSTREKIKLQKERKHLLSKELRDVSIRVNLFEKVLIPRTLENIRRIRIFLGDQMLAAVAQAKVAKRKIEQRKAGLV